MIDEKTPLTPNIRRLLAEFTTAESLPKSNATLADAIASLSSKEKILENSRKGLARLNEALLAIKSAPDNPYGEDDEEIAGVILKAIEEKRGNHGNKT